MSEPKISRLCLDCKWCGGRGEFSECRSPKNVIVEKIDRSGSDLVTGERLRDGERQRMKYIFCTTHRMGGVISTVLFNLGCGPQGRWWEEKIGDTLK